MAPADTTALIAKRSISLLLKPSLRPIKPEQALRSSKRHAHRVRSSDHGAGIYLPFCRLLTAIFRLEMQYCCAFHQ